MHALTQFLSTPLKLPKYPSQTQTCERAKKLKGLHCITNGYKRVFASFIFHSVSRNNHVVCGIFIVISRHYDSRPSNEFLTRGRVFQFNLHSNSFLAFIRISQSIFGIFHSQFSFALPFILNDFFWISLRWFQSPCHSWIPAAWIQFNSMSISTFLLFAHEAPVTHFSFLSRNKYC